MVFIKTSCEFSDLLMVIFMNTSCEFSDLLMVVFMKTSCEFSDLLMVVFMNTSVSCFYLLLAVGWQGDGGTEERVEWLLVSGMKGRCGVLSGYWFQG